VEAKLILFLAAMYRPEALRRHQTACHV